MWPNPQFPADLVTFTVVTFTEAILNRKRNFLRSAWKSFSLEVSSKCQKCCSKIWQGLLDIFSIDQTI